MYKLMKENGMSDENLRRFVAMEDYLLEIEKMSVCTGIPRLGEATSVSQQIKDYFVGYDFSYHTTHLKQIAEPNKFINKNLSCWSMIQSSICDGHFQYVCDDPK